MHAQNDLNLRSLCMFEGTFLLDAAHIIPCPYSLRALLPENI